jgi:hypothetical protein
MENQEKLSGALPAFQRQADDLSFAALIPGYRKIMLTGPDGSYLMQAMEIVPGGWVFTTLGTASLAVFGYQSLLSSIAEIISGAISRTQYIPNLTLITQDGDHWIIDGAGNAWIDTSYLTPGEYLPIMIPRSQHGESWQRFPPPGDDEGKNKDASHKSH